MGIFRCGIKDSSLQKLLRKADGRVSGRYRPGLLFGGRQAKRLFAIFMPYPGTRHPWTLALHAA
jgi:hypothetical protein